MYDWKNVTLTCSGSEINDFIIILTSTLLVCFHSHTKLLTSLKRQQMNLQNSFHLSLSLTNSSKSCLKFICVFSTRSVWFYNIHRKRFAKKVAKKPYLQCIEAVRWPKYSDLISIAGLFYVFVLTSLSCGTFTKLMSSLWKFQL